MAPPPTALTRTSTDTLVAILGTLLDSIDQLVAAPTGVGVMPIADVNHGVDYGLALGEVAGLLDARMAQG